MKRLAIDENIEDADWLKPPKKERGKPRPRRRKSFTPERKELAWKRVDAIARRWEPDFARAARAALESDRRHVLAIVQGEGKAARRYKATTDVRRIEAGLGEYLGLGSPENWRDEFTPVVAGIIEDQGAKWAADLGVAWNVRNVAGEKWFQDYMLKFARPIDDTTKAWLDYMLQRAMEEGWSVGQMSKAMEAMFDVWLGDKELTAEEAAWFGERLPQARRENIARTSTMEASNSGSHELFKEWGVKKKEWLSTMDPPRAREDHMAMNGQVVGIDEDFVNPETGATFKHPGDSSAGASEVCNCRCTELPVIED